MAEQRELTALPPDYYRSIARVEQQHWWHCGMRDIAASLLEGRLARDCQAVLDVGCGTGGYLEWLKATGRFARLAGIDVSAEALELTHERVPDAELALAGASEIPFADQSFDLVALNDVLQHIHEDELAASLAELRRVLHPDGALILRTNGAHHSRRDAADWRVYDTQTLRAELERGGFSIERITHANAVLSAWGELRGRAPRLPGADSHGIPGPAGGLATAVGSRVLGLEARLLRSHDRALPFGHTLFALATPASRPRSGPGEFFDEESVRYDNVYEASSAGGFILRARLATALQLIGDGPGNVLDAGMGGGRLVEELDRCGWTVSGVDISERMVALAQRRLPKRRESLRQGDLEALPFDDECFDVAVTTGALEYAIDLRQAIGELTRVVRPGGRVVASFPDYAAPFTVAQMRLWYPAVRLVKRAAPIGRPSPQPREHLLSPVAFARLLEAAGLVVDSVVPLGPRPLPQVVARRFARSGSRVAELLATQLVISAHRPAEAS